MYRYSLVALFPLILGLAGAGCGDSSDEPSQTPGTGGQGGAADAAADVPVTCATGKTSCDGQCVDTAKDTLNCGKCGTACKDGEVCSSGTCALACFGGTTTCGGTGDGGATKFCADLKHDTENCGGCGVPCALGEVCAAGTCSLTCPAASTKCGTSCVDTATDNANCGACGTACEAGEVCSAGVCAVTCQAGLSKCADKCVDTQSDLANCGACATACAAGEVCTAGKCALSCQQGLTNCSDKCVDTQSDLANCGACATACAAGQVCTAGKCALSCQQGLTNCSDKCVDTQTDLANCGACATACAAGQVCTAGQCVLSCQQGLTNCSEKCVDLQSDLANCGACAIACPAGQVCNAGTCAASCQSGLTDCDGSCVNVDSDPNHCGTCPTVCPSVANGAPVCAYGTCSYVCGDGSGDCNAVAGDGCEQELTNDPLHCGGCSIECPTAANAIPTCLLSTCGFACKSGFSDCDANPATGCEAELALDVMNCGSCGKKCTGAEKCLAGACSFAYSCAAIKAQQPGAVSGVFMLDVDGQGGLPSFQAYCDMTTAGGGWTLLSWVGNSSTATPYGAPYPTLANCAGLGCVRGSGVPAGALNTLFKTSKELATGQSVTTLKATFGTLGSYEFAGRYTYPSLDGLVVPTAAVSACTPFAKGVYHNIVGTAASEGVAVYLAQSMAYAEAGFPFDVSSDLADYIWSTGTITAACDSNGTLPGGYYGTWSDTQFGPGVQGVPGSYSIWVR